MASTPKSRKTTVPRSRRETNIATRRQRVLESARTLLNEDGQDGFSMRKLAEEADLSVTTLYNLVGSREDILRALIKDSSGHFDSTVAVPEAAGGSLRVRMLVLLWTCIVAVGFGGGFLSADEEEPAAGNLKPVGGLTFVDEVEVTIANIAVYVTDKKGRAVTDLTTDDFNIFQDGVAKSITNFRFYSDDAVSQQIEGPSVPGAATPTLGPVDESDPSRTPIHLVLYIDNLNLNPIDRNRVLSQARDFIRTSLHSPAQMMVVAYQRSFEVLQPFTSNPNEVLDALRQVRTYAGGRVERETAKQDIIERMHEIDQKSNPRPQGGSGRQLQEIDRLIHEYAQETDSDLKLTLDSLRQTVNSLSGLPGKKGIIYVSNGLEIVPGQQLFFEFSKYSQAPTALIDTSRYNRRRQFRQLAQAANSQDVAFYTVDATSVSLGNTSASEFATSQDRLSATVRLNNHTESLRLLADETGGIAIINTNDVGSRFELIRQDMFTYYSIGYSLQASGGDKIHKINVKLRDDPELSGYRLRYRSRFVEKSLESRVQDRVMSSLLFEINENPIGIEVDIGTPSAASEGRWLVPATISFPIGNVALLPIDDEYVARVAIFIAVRDNDGKRSDLVRQDYEVRVKAADYEVEQSRRWSIETQLLMESGRYKVAVAVLDPITRQAAYETVSTAVNPDR
jgi:VWFA-related protein